MHPRIFCEFSSPEYCEKKFREKQSFCTFRGSTSSMRAVGTSHGALIFAARWFAPLMMRRVVVDCGALRARHAAPRACAAPATANSFRELGLSPLLLPALSAAGIEQPTDVQRSAFAAVLSGGDAVLLSETGSGKTHTMFGPPGCLVEARVRQWCGESGGESTDAPRDWGLFPRAVLEMMRTPGVRSIRASAVEVYHENVFDLMNAREQLSLGSSKTKFGRRVHGATESGSDDVAVRGGLGGVSLGAGPNDGGDGGG
jgi:hypothetical protein